jgi:alpha-tubulin suppressor-like RCC1 family protein
VTTPAEIDSNTDWQMVAAGSGHSLGIRGGKLYGWGGNGNGRVGNGTTTDVTTPTEIDSNTDWTFVVAAQSHSLGIRGGKLFTWGDPTNGKLGNGTTTGNVLTPTQIGTLSDWQRLGTGYNAIHSLGLK